VVSRLVMGSVALLISLFSFSMAYMSYTPVFYTLQEQANSTIYSRDLPAGILQIWNRANTIYGFAWSAWGILGVLCMVLWLYVWIQKTDKYTFSGAVR